MQRTAQQACTHQTHEIAEPRAETCEDCGSTSNLRLCTSCGYVGCCESQLGHDRDHALAEKHPIIKSLPLSAHSFTWCYECRRYV